MPAQQHQTHSAAVVNDVMHVQRKATVKFKSIICTSKAATGSGVLQVPKEESIAEIRDRYMDINSHAASYNWKALKSSPGSDQVQLSCVL